MCGIAGIFNRHGIPPSSGMIQAMAHKLAHRGPDHEGFYTDSHCALASRRLTIIDLAGGNQPLEYSERELVLVFNGAIYNYRELRAELITLGHQFRTNSDAEVILAAYVQWSERCLERLTGMFAFAIWHRTTRTLFLARDRMGKKPLVYAQLPDGTLLFASEIKALLCHPELTPSVCAAGMDRMLDYGFNLAPDTFLHGIHHLMPGTFAVHDERGMRTATYWSLDLNQPTLKLSRPEAAEGLAWHLRTAVQRRLVADVPVAAYLSGGIDSSSVTALYAQLTDTPVQTLSITFEDAGYDERHYARLVSTAAGTAHHEFLCSIAEKDIENLIWHLETPLVTLLNLPLYLLSRQIHDMGFKVVLSGDGADEILGGYDYFKLVKLMPFIARQETPTRANLLRRVFPQLTTPELAWAQYQVLKTYPCPHPSLPYRFQAFQLKNQLLSDEFIAQLAASRDLRTEDLPVVPQHRALLDQALFLETRMRLPNLTLPLADTMSMANSVELRSPFMDHELVEYLFRLPAHYKMQGLNEKSLLKQACRPFLPHEICARRKQPLAPPGKWFVRKFRTLIGDTLSANTVRAKGYFHPECIDFMLQEFDADSRMDYSGVLVVAFFVHLWDSLFIRKAN